MPTQQPPPATVYLDSLIQSHCETDSDEDPFSASPNCNRRTVDEILLSHSSGDDEDEDDILASIPSSKSQRLSPHSSLSSDKHNSADALISNIGGSTKHAGIIAPHLFCVGVIRSNAKPGTALAAAAAAARPIPTPYAAAIKLKRANTGDLQRSSSETTENIITRDDSSFSSSAVDYTITENGYNAVTHDGNLDSVKSVAVEQYVVESRTAEKFDEDTEVLNRYTIVMEESVEDQLPRFDEDSECKVAAFETESMKNLISEEFCVDDPVVSQKTEEYSEVLPIDESGEKNEKVGSAPTLDDVSHDEDAIGGEEANNSGDIANEAGNGDAGATSQSDVADTVEYLVSLKQKSGSSLKALELAEEIEKQQAFTGLHYEEGVAAQPMRIEGAHRGSTVIGYFDVNANNTITRTISSQAFRRDHGSPQVVAIHLNYLAVGLSKGLIILVPSKYTAHHVDNMDAKMTYLGLQGDRSHAPVTSMCFNLHGDLLFAGYGDGHYTVWDVQKASALKVITEHRAPVVHMLYLGQDTQSTRQFNVVSGDSNGLIKLIHFSVVPWVNMISYSKPTDLFDESTGRVVCASPLIYGEGHRSSAMSSLSSSAVSNSDVTSMADEGVVVFITHQSALVAKVSPEVEVYATIPKPVGVREGAMPYAAWSCISHALVSSSENTPVQTADKVALLAIAWDRNIQVAKLLKSKLNVLEKWTLESAAVGLSWLGDQMLAILTVTGHLNLCSKDGNLIHQTRYSVDEYQGDGLISYHIYFTNALGNPEKAYHNSVAVRGATIYMLGSKHLTVSRLLSWKDRIEVLRKAGDWMGAFNMAMTLYDGQTYGVIDLPKDLAEIQRSLMPYLVELLHSYVREVFSYISVSCYSQNVKGDKSNEIKEQYTRVGGVAVEFCVHIGRTDILFDDILSKFEDAHQKETFLELLEPYILKDMLGSLPPVIMKSLVEHYSEKGWLQRIEQFVLHMDILSLDFNQIVRLCREHRLHCALIYLFNKGLDDFRTPLEELLVVLLDSTIEDATSLGYRILVYLKYCFEGLAFPPGRGNISPTRLPSLKKELLCFLLEDTSAQNSWACTSLPSNVAHTNVLHLLELDTETTLEVLKSGLTDVEHPKLADSSQSTNCNMESIQSQELVQKVVDILADILKCSNDANTVEGWPSMNDVYHMCDFIAYYVTLENINVSSEILSQVLEYLTSDVSNSDIPSDTIIQILKRREKQLLLLLKTVPESHWDALYVLNLCEKAGFHKVCGYIHAIRHQYTDAIDCYMKLIHEPVYAFSFTHDMLRLLSNEDLNAFESAVISRIPDLTKLSREATYLLITEHFPGKIQYILSDLRSHPESLFLYLKTVIEVHSNGTLDISRLEEVNVIDFPGGRRTQQQLNDVNAYLEAISFSLKLMHNNRVNVTDELMEQYFELLCRYERESVLQFLENSESYNVEHCLHLCQKYGITDAASFLLERVGDYGSALLLVLSNLGEKFVMLGSEIEKAHNLNDILRKRVVDDILDIVHTCVGLCQRNSPRLNPEESEFLWFQLLDFFCEPLMDSRNTRTDSERGAVVDILAGSLDAVDGERYTLEWKVSMFRGNMARMMKKLFSIFIKEIVEGMIGYVRLPQIMLKLLSDNSSQEFGDFKLTILGMLGAYDFERKILDSAKSLIEDDTYYTMSLLRKEASHGYALRDLICCICSSPLAKNNSFDSGIQVFSCGHAMHVQCEGQENRASFNGTIVGCPICIPRKKPQKSNGKSTLAENGLVNRSPAKMHQARVASTLHHPHDRDGVDSSYGLRPPSRFELLHNLENDQKLIQIEKMPPLRLAPPALYHEKVRKPVDIFSGESTSSVSTSEKTQSGRLKNLKVKGSSVRFPLKSTIFGKAKVNKS